MNDHDREDETLSRMMRAVRAEADPVLWTRVRARLDPADEPRGLIAWLMRPAALATSVAMLALASALTVALLRDTVPAAYDDATGFTDALIGVDATPFDALVIPADESPADTGGAS
jgi:hypothetical protein